VDNGSEQVLQNTRRPLRVDGSHEGHSKNALPDLDDRSGKFTDGSTLAFDLSLLRLHFLARGFQCLLLLHLGRYINDKNTAKLDLAIQVGNWKFGSLYPELHSLFQHEIKSFGAVGKGWWCHNRAA
jgi:hypothetical protein